MAHKGKKFLAFDLGAESGRAIVGHFDGERVELEVLHRFPNQAVTVHSTTYWDALRLFHEMKQGLAQSVQAYGNDVASMAIDTWGVDFGLLGSGDELLGNPIHYRDLHTEGMMEEAFKIVPREELFRATGNQFIRFNTLFQLLALAKRNFPSWPKPRQCFDAQSLRLLVLRAQGYRVYHCLYYPNAGSAPPGLGL